MTKVKISSGEYLFSKLIFDSIKELDLPQKEIKRLLSNPDLIKREFKEKIEDLLSFLSVPEIMQSKDEPEVDLWRKCRL